MLDLYMTSGRAHLENVPIGESTVSKYFLLNGRFIGKYVAREEQVQKKDWSLNVDKQNHYKKYATNAHQEVAAMLQAASIGKALIHFLVGTNFRIGEAAVDECMERPRQFRFTLNKIQIQG